MSNSTRLRLALRPGETTDLVNGSIFYVGTATVILQYAGFTVLTDPNFLHAGDLIHLRYGLSSHRLTQPAIDLQDLPLLDLCVLSHMHEDHFDPQVAERLDTGLPIITTGQAAADLKRMGFVRVLGLDTWDSISVVKGDAQLRITSMPATHAHGPAAFFLLPVMGSMLEFESLTGQRLLSLYITGDTVMFDKLKEIPRRFPNVDLMLLHLGGMQVAGMTVTMDDVQGLEMVKLIHPQLTLPIHYNDYTVYKSPLEDFKRAIDEAGLNAQVTYLSGGDTYPFVIS